MSDRENALKITRALIIALQAYEQIGGNTGRLMILRNTAKAENREISPEELDTLLAESQAALDDLQAALASPQASPLATDGGGAQ